MQDAGCRMRDASLSSQPSSEAGSGEGLPSLRATAGRTQRSLLTQKPAWMEAGAIREISATKMHVFIHILYKPGNPLPICEAFGWGGLCGKGQEENRTFLQGGSQCFLSLSQEPPRKGQRCPWLPAPVVVRGLGTTAAQVRSQWHEPQESSHSPHRSPAFTARMGNSPLQIQEASPPREQTAPSLQWEHAPDVTWLWPVPTQTETTPNPGCWHTSLHLYTTAVPGGTAHSIASPRWAAARRRSGSAPNTCPRPLPGSTCTLGHRTARCVMAPLQVMAKGSQPHGDTVGHVPLRRGAPER